MKKLLRCSRFCSAVPASRRRTSKARLSRPSMVSGGFRGMRRILIAHSHPVLAGCRAAPASSSPLLWARRLRSLTQPIAERDGDAHGYGRKRRHLRRHHRTGQQSPAPVLYNLGYRGPSRSPQSKPHESANQHHHPRQRVLSIGGRRHQRGRSDRRGAGQHKPGS